MLEVESNFQLFSVAFPKHPSTRSICLSIPVYSGFPEAIANFVVSTVDSGRMEGEESMRRERKKDGEKQQKETKEKNARKKGREKERDRERASQIEVAQHCGECRTEGNVPAMSRAESEQKRIPSRNNADDRKSALHASGVDSQPALSQVFD